MVLIRKRPDGLFERISTDGRVDLFMLAEDDGEQAGGLVSLGTLWRDEAVSSSAGTGRSDD